MKKAEKVTVKMLVTKNGSQDGLKVEEFIKGEIYTIEDSLAKVFLQTDVDIVVNGKRVKTKIAEKSTKKKETKVAKPVKETKA